MQTPTEAEAPSWDGVWIVIPAYQEERTIRALAQEALARCPRVIVVDDGSSDGSRAQLEGLPVTLLVHARNQGKAASLCTAFEYALSQEAQCVIALDGDGQHDPADVPGLLAAWRRHPERIIIGSRLHDRAQFPPARYRANRFACFWISWAAGHPIADSQSGFRVYSREVMRIALSGKGRGSRFTFESEILIEAAGRGHRTLAVAIPGRYPVHARASHFRPVIDIAKIVVMVAKRLLQKGMAPLGLWRSLQAATVLPGRSVPLATTPLGAPQVHHSPDASVQ
ncbi:glycosyltransferase family 2 protein [Ramlibacter sp. WS9]|uniref:glycosyltransferase family 2 protein n=1 Tax=Ramlibacter sp. WS9 TaxID=1882741 RepID=UPI00114242EC|nr:glycosyltransferase family 2 protein [Ramlibacter sp. WS9]ROZ79483.1 glycosyltransferase family 2 protein [Ramlibacter sp. WS9]